MGRSRSPHGERGLKYQGRGRLMTYATGRSPHGERGLKCRTRAALPPAGRRSPHGERGLKSPRRKQTRRRGGRRSPHGERGLKWTVPTLPVNVSASRSPHGERGLKCALEEGGAGDTTTSLPSRGAWIEICRVGFCNVKTGVAPLTGSVD